MSRVGIAAGRGPGPRLTIVVPTLSDPAALEDTLVSVLENRPPDCEIVVPLGCSYDDPWRIGDEVTFVRQPARSLVDCINAGLEVCSSPFVHVLAAGWKATSDWTVEPLDRLARGAAAVAPVELTPGADQRVAAAGIAVSRGGRHTVVGRGRDLAAAGTPALVAAAPTLEAGFWQAGLLRRAGGFSACCGDALAAADMVPVLTAAGGGVAIAAESRVVQGSPRHRARGFRAARQAERLFWRAGPAGRTVGGLIAHAAEIVREAWDQFPFGMFPAVAGRIAGLCEVGASRERLALLREIAAEACFSAADEVSPAEPGTLRIDSGEDRLAGPRRRKPALPLRRSA